MRFKLSNLNRRSYPNLTLGELKKVTNNFKTENGYNVCPYCNREMIDETFIHYDHVVAYSKKPVNDNINNIIPVCKYCNRSKNDEDFQKWYRNQIFYNKQVELKILNYLNSENTYKFFEKSHKGIKINNGDCDIEDKFN